MASVASRLGGRALLLSSPVDPRQRARRSRRGFSGAWNSVEPRDRRWYNPERHRQPNPVRRWVEAETCFDLPDCRDDRFVLISHNILGVNNILEYSNLYMRIPSDSLQWESRKRLICDDLRGWDADIFCLQALDRYYDVESFLRKDGYAGSYKRRTGDAKDGCAIFWKKERFSLLEASAIEFTCHGLRDNVAQLFVFEEAYALSEKWGRIPVVLAGDFNSTPQSAIYEFLSTSELNITQHDRKSLSGQERLKYSFHDLYSCISYCWTDEEIKNASGNSNCTILTHPFRLHSSYASVKGNGMTRSYGGEPFATSYHSKFIGTLDYIWYSTGLECARVLDTLTIASLRGLGGLPNKTIGSDHLALVAEFVFNSRSTGPNLSSEATEKEGSQGEDN
ncbi:hypothetical protein HPP92_024525 [Vanilla planifolia]|uniref:Endonuclease/exonuclease/phosphatase domain-containing protein n=1 Tax=Vanilla planifolia TaxID=51239 RepID=A0A835PSE0_VANPL|nr:hypothetical protein HPP92_024525 [Vanilla planifolia]